MRRRLNRALQLADKSLWAFFSDGCPQRAAAISFYALFSLFPLAILAAAVLGFAVDDGEARATVIDFVLDNLPLTVDEGRRDLERLLLDVTRNVAGFGALGVVTLMLAASAVMGAIRHALNAAFDSDDHRPPAQAKVVDLLLVLGFGVLVLLSTTLTIAERATESFSEAVDDLVPGAGGAIVEVVVELGQLLPLAMAFVIFAVLFRIVPSAGRGLRDTWPGVLIAALGYEASKTAFAIYIGSFADYGAVYASLATVMVFLVFVWIASNVVLLGAEAAAHWPAVRSGAYDAEAADPFGKRVRDLIRGLFLRPR